MIRIYRPPGWILAIAAGLLVAYCMFFKDGPQPNPEHAEQKSHVVAEQAGASPSRLSAASSWGASPFTGTATAEDITAQLATMRYDKMKKLGYETPAKYYQMNLTQLEGLAKQGDAYAMLQLAEQYYSESDYIKNDPAYDRSRKPREIGMEHFEDAIRAGYTHAASVIAMQMAGENRTIDAYAWRLLSDRFNDHANDKTYEQYAVFDKMTAMDKAEARGKLDTILQRYEAERK
jgi:hypothetical protein